MYTNHVMLAVNNVNEINAVRTLYVCQISIIDQSYPMNIGNAQHMIHRIVAISKITVTIILFFVIGCRSFVFLLRNPKRKNRTANRQRTIVVDDKMMSKSCVPLISYDCVRLPSNISLTFRTRLILVFAPLVSKQTAVRSFGSRATSVLKLGLPPDFVYTLKRWHCHLLSSYCKISMISSSVRAVLNSFTIFSFPAFS